MVHVDCLDLLDPLEPGESLGVLETRVHVGPLVTRDLTVNKVPLVLMA